MNENEYQHRTAHPDRLAEYLELAKIAFGSRRRGIEYGEFSITSVREAARNLATAASVLLESSPKKRIHRHDIPLSLRMSGQFCTYWSFRFFFIRWDQRLSNLGPMPSAAAVGCWRESVGQLGGVRRLRDDGSADR